MSTRMDQTAVTAYEQLDARPITKNQKNIIALVIAGNLAEYFDMFLIGFVVALLTKPWHLTGFEAGFILACAGLGTVLGAVTWGRLADSLGRRSAYRWCVIMFVGFTALTLATPDRGWFMLALLRIGVGMGVGGLNISSIAYVQEFVPSRRRGLLTGLGSVFIPMGLFLGSIAQKIAGEDWRLLILLGCIPVFLLVWLHFVPESPRFLAACGRFDEARASLAWAMQLPESEVGPIPKPTVNRDGGSAYRLLLTKYRRSLILIVIASFSFILGVFAVQSWGQTLLKEGFGYSVSAVASMFMAVSFIDLIGRFGSAALADVIGRRWTLFLFGVLAAAGCGLAALSTQPGDGLRFYIAVLIIMGFGDGAFGIVNAHGAEQFPTSIRSSGLGLGYGLGATAKIFGPAAMGAMIGGSVVKQDVTLDVIAPCFLFFGLCLLIGAVTYLFTKESKGLRLAE